MDLMTEEANNSGVEVEIFGQVFNFDTDPERGIDPDYLLELAGYVDAKMRAIADEGHTVDYFRLAVFAALNIAHECHRLKTSPKPLTEEERQRNRERRQRHYTKRTYEKQLLAIMNDESIPAKERHEFLLTLGRVRGYHRAPKSRR